MRDAPATTPDIITETNVATFSRWRAIYGPPLVHAIETTSKPAMRPAVPVVPVAINDAAENAQARVVEGRGLLLRVHPGRGRFCDCARSPTCGLRIAASGSARLPATGLRSGPPCGSSSRLIGRAWP